MDYIDQLKQLSSRVEQLKSSIATEEATKTALILPFFQLLGYDVFNPLEFVPEYVADVGIKKGEKVDYAILIDGKPAILVEAKWCGEKLDNHSSQLFRYFGTTPAKIGILTNGICYRFYTDLDEPNKMDLTPFMEIDMLNIHENLIPELKRFQRDSFDADKVFNAASELKYTSAIKSFLTEQTATPSEDFVRYIVGQVYSGHRTQAILEKFKPIVKRSLNQYLNDILNERFKSMMSPPAEETLKTESATEEEVPAEVLETSGINTTAAELEAFVIIKTLLHDTVDPARLTHKDTISYFGILIDNKPSRWICRLSLEGRRKSIMINHPAAADKTQMNSLDDLFNMKDKLLQAAKQFL